MLNNFGFLPNNNSDLNFKQPQSTWSKRTSIQKESEKKQEEKKPNNPFNFENLFTFKKPDLVYDRVMKSNEMLGFLKAQKLAGQFLSLTKPEFEVGKRLNYEI